MPKKIHSIIEKSCLYCGTLFETTTRETNRGNGKYCSLSCSARNRKSSPKIPNTKCAKCSKEFYRNKSKKGSSKSGLFFCNRKCKDEAQKIGGLKQIMPSHYGTSTCYRTLCFKHHKKECVVCGEDKIVAVHHYDHNHNNNNIENLIPLCPTHHQYMHSRHKDLIEKEVEEYVHNFTGVAEI